jgi:hypothetical protein
LFAKPAECTVPRIDVQLIGIDQGTVNVEDESEHGDKGGIKEGPSNRLMFSNQIAFR